MMGSIQQSHGLGSRQWTTHKLMMCPWGYSQQLQEEGQISPLEKIVTHGYSIASITKIYRKPSGSRSLKILGHCPMTLTACVVSMLVYMLLVLAVKSWAFVGNGSKSFNKPSSWPLSLMQDNISGCSFWSHMSSHLLRLLCIVHAQHTICIFRDVL